jgi:hypothetical protein
MYDNGPGTRALYRFHAIAPDGTASVVCPPELFPSLGSFRLASKLTSLTAGALATGDELKAAFGEFAPSHEEAVHELDGALAALATAHVRVHGGEVARIRVDRCEMPESDPAELRCAAVHEWVKP